VEAATSQYRSEEDVLGEFINERCLVDATVKVKGGELYTAFKGWQESRGERAWGAKAFSGELCQRFDRHRNNGTWYLGIGLKVDSWSETE
jgi:putative DNA primase/helicase